MTGIRIAVDDYGRGYSSLKHLKRLPIAILKIDQSFISDIGKDPNDTIIIKSTIQLADNLGLKVVGEGVKIKKQLQFLQKHGCEYVQGYYFSRPIGLKKYKKYLKNFNSSDFI